MTKALRQALAYLGVRGIHAKGIHVDTRLAAHDYVEFINPVGTDGRYYRLTAEGEELVKDEPFTRAHRYLTKRGFRPVVWPDARTLHCIEYINNDTGDKALAYRSGSISILPGGRWMNATQARAEEVASDE